MKREMLSNLWFRLTAGLVLVSCLLIGVGCANTAPSRANAPPQGECPNQHPCQENYVRMADNALLDDMSMSAVHFVPRSDELNALGVRRLIRMAKLLKTYGGSVFYDGTEPNRELRQDRAERIEAFLAASGLDANQFAVEQGPAGGRGLDASEAVDIREATRGPTGGEDTSGSAGGTAAASGT